MSLFKRILSLCLCLVLLGGFCAAPLQSLAAEAARSSAFAGIKGPTLVKQDGIWYYVKNGAVCYDTTLVKFNGAWWYVTGGKLASNTTTLVKFNNAWWYVVKGKVASNTTSLVKFNNAWWYVVKGKVASNTTSLVKFNNEWWYVVKGKVASATTTLVKFNNEWWYVVKGKIAANTTTLVKFNGAWYYIYKGKLAANTTTLFKYLGKWYYVERGKVNTTATTLVPFSGQWYYVKNGTTQPTATTLVKYDGLWYYVQNGVLKKTTTFCSFNDKSYYVEQGMARTDISGRVTVNGTAYYVRNGIRTNCHVIGHSWKAATCTTPKTCTKCTVTSGAVSGHDWVGNLCLNCNTTKGAKITLEVWTSAEDQTEDGWLIRMEEKFAAAHPEYQITWVNSVCSEGDAGSLVTADPAAAGDVYMFAHDQLGVLVSDGAISRLGGDYAAQVKNDNSPVLVDTVTYTDGNIYGFPITSNTWFMYYNKDVFSEEDVKDLDVMLEKGVVAFPWGVGWYGGTFFFANGGKIFGDHGLDASAGIQFGAANGGYEAALKMVQLADNPNFKDDCDGLGCYGLKTGEVGAFFSGSWDAAGLREALGDKLGAVQLPVVEIGGAKKQMMSFAGSKAVGVNPNTANPKAATQFAAFLASVEGQKLRYEMRGVIPAAKALANDPLIKQDEVAVAEINTMANTSVVQPFLPEMSQYWTPVGNFGGLISNGEVNERNYKEQVNQLMDALNNTGL